MRKYVCLWVAVCLTSIIASQNSLAQVNPGDSSSQQNAFNNAVNLYHSSMGNQLPIYTGKEYFFYDPTYKGNAYFLDVNAFTPGSIYYDGALYTGIPMLYDLYSDEVVVLLYNHFTKFSLLKYRVKSFDYLDHHFVNINTDTLADNTSIKSGYYDQLYNGKLQVLVKRSKSIQTNTGGTLGAERYFSPSRDFYLKKKNTYYSITGKGSLLNVLKDKKKEIQQYIRANQIRYGSDPEEAMVRISSYYDHLTN